MPRKRRLQSPTGVYHWITRGINKKELFHHPKDYDHFKNLLAEYKQPYEILVYHYCLMRNHVHMLIYSPSVEATARFSQYVHRRTVPSTKGTVNRTPSQRDTLGNNHDKQ